MSQRSNDPNEDRDSQKPWQSEKVPHLDENWDNAVQRSIAVNEVEDMELMEEGPAPSSMPVMETKPKEIHDLVTLNHKMNVGNFELLQKTEILTITLEDNQDDKKVIKRQTRKIIDHCQTDLSNSQMMYEITETKVNGQKPVTASKTDMCFEEIEYFHNIWDKNWCPEMTEEQIIRAGKANQAGFQTNIPMPFNNDSKAAFGLGGSRMGGSRMAGSRMAGSRIGGSRMGGSRMGGSRMGGSRMGGSRMIGSRVAGQGLIENITSAARKSMGILSQLFKN